ncbi:MAG: hypothetical protein MUD05_05040 [Candidatus Nanopelagicales bacterium]|nr:hypothetical protein [Candidatus Nanopelagicales bacterium]
MSNQHTGGVSRLPILGMVVLSLLVWLAGPARSVPLPAPTPLTPSAVAVVDQPVFTWTAVPGADHYDVQVSLDDDFATLSDPLGGGEVVVYGTTYIPTFTYGAKTHFWRVRAVADDGAAGSWSAGSEFTRRWTNDDEPAGTPSAVPASRVENVRLIGANPAPPELSQVRHF